ncbi:MAG: hypothetical protein A2087_08965 [Spirochaetes bacterium GWD1_61_31]|nr:MAG: hypothetical protein A2Y37_13410 [Spirochaetes bacterium GWB1_60_80]OHD30045.1 MAG: hypothetical protein A2004_03485 [Spirochaetes bacterium GWC1_61_12]OHD42563.1 MAG: hypothetical protein A2087_08965 [Spirochaetes bacterium GWD1_61_31]OHD45051.1 MAG: hypothetical protein A2Y35_12630 [Spirochaetes bacterium GWE1_60_18]OHD59980.1 MAG: hypothetical protein A2Y32_14485 [Spirochaetes bacterium GWF1_60_12]HAP42948.1 hypothetical protein [Spirochaetaceae bacterium]
MFDFLNLGSAWLRVWQALPPAWWLMPVRLLAQPGCLIALGALVFWSGRPGLAMRLALLAGAGGCLVEAILNRLLEELGLPPDAGLLYGRLAATSAAGLVLAAGLVQTRPAWEIPLSAQRWTRVARAGLAVALPALVTLASLRDGGSSLTAAALAALAGGGLAAVWLLPACRLEKYLARLDSRLRIGLVAALAFLMNAVVPELTGLAGLLFGGVLGSILLAGRLGMNLVPGLVRQRWLFPLAGLTGLVLVSWAGDWLLPVAGREVLPLARFVHGLLAALWITVGHPMLGQRLGWLRQPDPPAEVAG